MKALAFTIFAATFAMSGGCAHEDLHRAIDMGLFQPKSVENVQRHAENAYPAGMSRSDVLKRLGPGSGDVPPALMALTLRPWPFTPWAVWSDGKFVRASSENDRNWIEFWHRTFLDLEFEFDEQGRLRRIRVSRNEIAL